MDSTSPPIDVGDPDITLHVLGPRLEDHQGNPAYRWLTDDDVTVNAHSVILRLDFRFLDPVFRVVSFCFGAGC